MWWHRWAPLVVALPGIGRWSPEERRSLAELILAKGGRRESDFVWRFDAHVRLRAALRALTERPPGWRAAVRVGLEGPSHRVLAPPPPQAP
jgi:hypothetical protein